MPLEQSGAGEVDRGKVEGLKQAGMALEGLLEGDTVRGTSKVGMCLTYL